MDRVREHLPYVLPIVFSNHPQQHHWSIGLEVTLSVLGFTDLDTPTVGTMIFLANQHSAMISALVVVRVPDSFCHHHLHRALLAGGVDERIYRSRSRLSRMGGGTADCGGTEAADGPCFRSSASAPTTR